MSNTQENQIRMRRSVTMSTSETDMWKQLVTLDAIRSDRKVKARITKFF